MAYRFTDTDKWKDNWFGELKPVEKLLFIYLCDNCDIAGFAEVNLRRWAFDLDSTPSTIEGAKEGLRRGLIFSKCNEIIFIKNFLKHQKNLPLNLNNNAHLGICKRILMYADKFDNEFINELIEGAKEGLRSPTGKGNGNGNGKGKGKKEYIEGVPSSPSKAKKRFIPPSLEEVKAYATSRGRSDLVKSFFDYYDAGDWSDKDGKAVKNWKQKFISWENRSPKAETQERKIEFLN